MELPPDPVQTRRKQLCAACLDLLLMVILAGVATSGVLREATPPLALPPPLWVDVTRADATTLRLLPGIGAVRAEAIVADRRYRGPVPHLDALTRVPGIGPGIVARLREARWVRAVIGTPPD